MPKFSQVFLKSDAAAHRIAQAVFACDADIIVEIGPGKGFLTSRLMQDPRFFGAIEIDPEMAEILKRKFAGRLNLINRDFLEADLYALLPQDKKVVFAGNLPYAVASPILQKVLDYRGFSAAVFMFQKEVVDRITAACGDKQYGLLAISAQTKSDVRRLLNVGKRLFHPVPKVDSAVAVFLKKSVPFFESSAQEEAFFRVARAAFAQRRKTVLNSVCSALGLEKAPTAEAMRRVGIDPELRAEKIPPQDFLKLVSAL